MHGAGSQLLFPLSRCARRVQIDSKVSSALAYIVLGAKLLNEVGEKNGEKRIEIPCILDSSPMEEVCVMHAAAGALQRRRPAKMHVKNIFGEIVTHSSSHLPYRA